jgi:sodium transport system permease protein
MKLHGIGIVFRKELIDSLRDRRTLASMVLVPVLVTPLLMLGLGTVTARSIGKALHEVPRVMLLGGQDSPKLLGALQALKDIRLVPVATDFTNQIS